MDLPTLTIVMAAIGAIVPGVLGFVFLVNPEKGLAMATHRAELLPNVMTDRYFGLTALAIAAAFYGDLKVIAFLYAVFAFLALADTFIYARHGHEYAKHLMAGLLSLLVVLVACYSLFATGVSV